MSASVHPHLQLNISLIQTSLDWESPTANREQLAQLMCEDIFPNTTDLIILPEMFTSGFTMNPAHVAETMEGETVQWLRQMATDLNAVITGSLVIREQNRFYNRLIWMRPDGTLEYYNKRHLFRMAQEDEHYTGGTEQLQVELHGWRIRPLICYDLRFPLWSRQTQDDPYDLLIYVANWPQKRRSTWNTLLAARAMENLSYVIGVNRVGEDGNGIPYAGESQVLDAAGRSLLECGDHAGFFQINLSREALERARRKFPVHLDSDDFVIR